MLDSRHNQMICIAWLFKNISYCRYRPIDLIHLPVEIIEEWEQINCQFDPAFALTFAQGVCEERQMKKKKRENETLDSTRMYKYTSHDITHTCIHDGCWIIQSRAAHNRSIFVPNQYTRITWLINKPTASIDQRRHQMVASNFACTHLWMW